MENKQYLFSNGGIIEAPDDWVSQLKDSQFTDSYEGLLEGKYMIPTEEQIAFFESHRDNYYIDYDLYHQYNMIEIPVEELNEKIRQEREDKYTAQTDKLYMAYIKYKEFGEMEKAEEAYNTWKTAVQNIEFLNPYVA